VRTFLGCDRVALAMAVALCAGVAQAGEAEALLGNREKAATPIERLVPADTVGLVQVTNLAALGAAFDQSALADAIKASTLLTYLKTVAGAGAEFAAVALTGQPAAELRACLGQNAGIALLSFKDAADAKQRAPIVVLIESTDAKKLESILTGQIQLFSLLNKEIAIAERQQGGATVRELASPKGDRLAYCALAGFLVLGTPGGVNALLDDVAAKKPPLATDPTYQAVRQQLAAASGISAYVNIRSIFEKTNIQENPAELVKLRGIGIADAQALGLAIDFQGRQIRERLYLYTAGKSTGVLKLLTQGPPVSPSAAQFIPPNYTFYASMGLSEVGLWDRIRMLIEDTAGPAAFGMIDQAARDIQAKIGIQIKEGIVDAIGEELFLAADLTQLPAFQGTGRQPKPEEIPFIFGAKLSNKAALKDTLDRVAANEALWEKGVERTTAKLADTDVFTFRIPMAAEIKPSYAFADNQVLLSIRPEAVRTALEAGKSKKNLAAAAFVQQGAATLPATSHVRIEVNDAQLLSTLLALIRKDIPESAQKLLADADKIIGGLHGYHVALRREPQGFSLVTLSDLGSFGTIVVAALIMDQFKAQTAKRVEADFDKIGAALEKYREKNGSYPETLEQLAPEFLPELTMDRFAPKRPYGYSRGRPGADGKLPDAWILVSVGPDEKPDIPVDQFDLAAWQAKLQTQDPAEIERLKALIYQFRKDQFPDERKNDDEGDIFRIGGRGAAAK